MYSFNIFTFVVCILYTLENVRSDYILSIKANSNPSKFVHFWRSTGFCPPEPRTKICEYLLSEDVKTNLMLIGALPNKSIKQIRIHWLLDLITIRSFYGNDTIEYDFTYLDSIIDYLYLQNLRPGFEIMGNPSSYFNNFLDVRQIKQWTSLIRDIVLRYVEKYKVEYVSKWRFETWNEPDLKGYNTLNFTFPSYMAYVWASAEGLNLASQKIKPTQGKFKLGGPAGLFKSPTRHPLCWGLISACGEAKGSQSLNCPLSFISFHKKGDGGTQGILDKGLELVKGIHTNYSNLRSLPVANDEADILTGWSKSVEWRADVRYAAMIVKVIVEHYNEFIKKRGIKIEVLSNDNGFLNYHPYYFTQRTLLARFQMNNTKPPHIQFIKKPVYTTMALLSYLGKKVLNTAINANFSYLATTTTHNKVDEFSIILSYVNDTRQDENYTKIIDISVTNLPRKEFKYVVYSLNNQESNVYRVWKQFGSPVFPNSTVREKMRQIEGPIRKVPPTDLPSGANLSLKLTVILPSIALVHVCSDAGKPPGQVTGLHVFNVTVNEVLVVWKDKKVGTKCILSYEIEFLGNQDTVGHETDDLLFKKVNFNNVIFLWFQYVAKDKIGTHGMYRVRAVDYWGRFGPYSNSVQFP